MTENDIDTTEGNHSTLGVFQIPTHSNLLSNHESDPTNIRQGASFISDAVSDGDGQHTSADDFPMVVWLRGDEPWFNQFDMDADATMVTLGIKRSRLTQIAGRDLRVGRVRVDRYIRPVFRSIDVAAYLNQTRATASHQKSSEVIQVASQAFNEQIDRFQNTLDAISSNLTAQLNSVLGTLISESMSQNMTPIHARVDSLEADLVNRISVMIQDTIVKHVDSLKAQVTASEREAAASINNLVKNLESTKAELNLSASTISERLKILDDAILSTKTDVRACATSMDHAIKATQNDIAQLRDMISSKKDDQTEQVQPKAVLAWRSSPRRRRMRPS